MRPAGRPCRRRRTAADPDRLAVAPEDPGTERWNVPAWTSRPGSPTSEMIRSRNSRRPDL